MGGGGGAPVDGPLGREWEEWRTDREENKRTGKCITYNTL